MARMSNKQRALNREYSKQVSRINRAVKRNAERGYQALVEVLPDRPKRVTAATIRKMKRITPQAIRKKSVYVDPSTGEIFSSASREKFERSERSRKAAATRKRKREAIKSQEHDMQGVFDREQREREERRREDLDNLNHPKETDYDFGGGVLDSESTAQLIINNYLEECMHFPRAAGYVMRTWINNLRDQHGDVNVANMITEAKENDLILTAQIAYSGSEMAAYKTRMLAYLDTMDDETKREVDQSFDKEEDLPEDY